MLESSLKWKENEFIIIKQSRYFSNCCTRSIPLINVVCSVIRSKIGRRRRSKKCDTPFVGPYIEEITGLNGVSIYQTNK